ncbi:MlaD family protein [Algoriphagus sp. CAU 1675]|uniref:MlaD family protein n=1 Tax=Algoriphagus sp. CAU 1675 TaxID=3032597 RepID=UPI0023DC8D31|nr:MlaD family protein [Algoriphagus sp. CAU 1675]MDF2157872.1 MlaD family protein [Algoriphagus sp. CAU 1675]
MKDKKKIENAKLGALVIAGVLFLVFALYMIGKNQNIFGASITIISVVDNVNGLVPGNNVRFQGMDVGTVRSIDMSNDSTIQISLYVRKSMQPHIKKNSLTTISTDGLMGNKIIHIIPQDGFAEPIEEGDIIYAKPQIGTEEMLNRLDVSGDYLEKTLLNLAEITEKLNQNKNIWALLSDSVFTENIADAVNEIRMAGLKASEMADAGKNLLEVLQDGDGLVNKVFTDSVMSENFSASIEQILKTSEEAQKVMLEAKEILKGVNEGQGTAGAILTDSLMKESILNSIQNVESSTYNFNQNMEALKNSFLFRRYFRKLEKEKNNK